MKLRSTYQPFIKSVETYFQELLPHVTDLQVTAYNAVTVYVIIDLSIVGHLLSLF